MATKKTAAKKPATRKKTSVKKACRSLIKQAGINKTTGKLLKGWKYKNGVPVKAVPKKKPVAKKKAVKKKPAKTTKK